MTATTGPARVVIVEDHPVLRRGLHNVLGGAPDLVVVSVGPGAAQAMAEAAVSGVDVVLVDLANVLAGAVEVVLALDPNVPVVVMGQSNEPQQVVEAVRPGVVGYVLEDADPGDLVQAVRAAAAGQAVFSPPVAKALLSGRPQGQQTRSASAHPTAPTGP
jgi:DNA-binding NarL/FixJ family response regulator